MKLSSLLVLSLIFTASAASANIVCTPAEYGLTATGKSIDVGTASQFGPLTITQLDSSGFSSAVSSVIQTSVNAPVRYSPVQHLNAKALHPKRVGFSTFIDTDQKEALLFWNSWDAPGNKVTYDLEDSVLAGKAGSLEVWGTTNVEAENPADPGTPALLGSFTCKSE